MSLLDTEEHIINEKWLREEGWTSASENPGCLEFRIYIHYGENRLTYIQFLLGVTEPSDYDNLKLEKPIYTSVVPDIKLKLLCQVVVLDNYHLSCLIPIDILYVDFDCDQQLFKLIMEGLLKKTYEQLAKNNF